MNKIAIAALAGLFSLGAFAQASAPVAASTVHFAEGQADMPAAASSTQHHHKKHSHHKHHGAASAASAAQEASAPATKS